MKPLDDVRRACCLTQAAWRELRKLHLHTWRPRMDWNCLCLATWHSVSHGSLRNVRSKGFSLALIPVMGGTAARSRPFYAADRCICKLLGHPSKPRATIRLSSDSSEPNQRLQIDKLPSACRVYLIWFACLICQRVTQRPQETMASSVCGTEIGPFIANSCSPSTHQRSRDAGATAGTRISTVQFGCFIPCM